MSQSPSHTDIQELLGAYSLDAVDERERDQVDDHLSSCPRCRAEVAEHRETASLLAFAGQAAPEGLWDRIAASLEEAPPPIALHLPVGPRGGAPAARRSPARALWTAGLVAAAAVVISLLALTVSLRDDGGGRRDFESAIAGQPRVELTSTDGKHSAHLVVTDGRGYVFNDNLPPLDDDRVYQLWGRKGTDLISLGLLGTDPEQEQFVAGDEFDAYAITVEEAGGVVRSEQVPVVAGRISTS